MNVLKEKVSILRESLLARFPNLNCYLESVKTSRFRHLNFGAKSFNLTHTTSMHAVR